MNVQSLGRRKDDETAESSESMVMTSSSYGTAPLDVGEGIDIRRGIVVKDGDVVVEAGDEVGLTLDVGGEAIL